MKKNRFMARLIQAERGGAASYLSNQPSAKRLAQYSLLGRSTKTAPALVTLRLQV